jgi:hypothetical protein
VTGLNENPPAESAGGELRSTDPTTATYRILAAKPRLGQAARSGDTGTVRHLPDLEKPVSGASQGAGSDSVTADRGAALRNVHTATYAHGTHSFRQRGSVPGSQTLRQ